MIEDPKDCVPALYLLKSAPHDFSMDDLATRPGQTERWLCIKCVLLAIQAPKATMIEDPKDSGPALYLLKSEPKDFSIDDLATRPGQTEPWDGVRNAQARNIMQRMKLGDQCLFYHSNTREVCKHT